MNSWCEKFLANLWRSCVLQGLLICLNFIEICTIYSLFFQYGEAFIRKLTFCFVSSVKESDGAAIINLSNWEDKSKSKKKNKKHKKQPVCCTM